MKGFQAAGAQGHLLVKTETGQYQLLRVGPGPMGGTTVGSPVVTSSIPALQSVGATAQQPNAQSLPVVTTTVINQAVSGQATYRFPASATTVQTVPAGQTVVTSAASVPTSTAGTGGNSGQV